MNRYNQYQPMTVSHPGLTLAEKLSEMGMGKKEFATRVDKPEKTITHITKGDGAITPDMAVKFEEVLRIKASFWLKRQAAYDEYVARLHRQEELKHDENWAKNFPYTAMAKLGWVTATKKAGEKLQALLQFFQIATPKAWEDYYLNKTLKVEFRISLAHVKEPFAMSAWLRGGELLAQKMKAEAFDAKRLRAAIPQMRMIMKDHPEDFFLQLQDLCLNCGLKVVHTPCLPKAPIHGCTRWLGDTPLIQLSGRYKTNDVFWFTFFHELGHILEHGKKYISLEKVKYDEVDAAKEKEADDFAIEHTFSPENEERLMSRMPMGEKDIVAFAEEVGTHPALIVGRLHKRKVLPYTMGRNLLVKLNFD